MRKLCLSAIALYIFVGSTFVLAGDTPSQSTDAAKASDPLAAVVPYVGGEWRIKGSWKDGRPIDARESFEYGIGKKFIVCKTFVQGPKGEYQRYETIFGQENGKLMAWAFVFDGHVDVSEFKVEGKKMSSSRVIKGETPAVLHQSLELIEPNKFRWLVSMEQNGKVNEMMDGFWVRDSSATAAPTK